jgi:type VI secretion system protein ImpK
MTPKFAQAIDPIFLHVLDLIERIDADENPDPQDERLRIRAQIDQAEAVLGSSEEWTLAKYGIVSWIDEMLVDSPWEGREWWSNNILEVEFFNTRLCNEQFYLKAKQAATLPRRDALEVFYNCVVLGFRGLYRDPMLTEMLSQSHGLPADLETWSRQTSLSIRLGQGRAPLTGEKQAVRGAPPRNTLHRLIWSWLLVVLLASVNIVFLFYKVVAAK